MRTALCLNFPDHQGNYREFSRFRATEADLELRKPRIIGGFSQNSLLNGSGNFKMLSGNYFAGSGNFLEITGEAQSTPFRGRRAAPIESESGQAARNTHDPRLSHTLKGVVS